MFSIYIDKLSLCSLLSIAISHRNCSQIFYFHATPFTKCLAVLFVRLKLLRTLPHFLDFSLSELMDEEAGSLIPKITEDTMIVCKQICEKEFLENEIILAFKKYFDLKTVLLFFYKIIEEEIKESVVLCNVVIQHVREKHKRDVDEVIFYTEHGLWSSYLSDYASQLGIKAEEHRTLKFPFKKGNVQRIKDKLIVIAKRKFINRVTQSRKSQDRVKSMNLNNHVKNSAPIISAFYTGRQVTFNLNKRSDFFWFLRSDIPRDRILIYFEKPHLPATEEIVAVMKEQGIKFVSLSNKATLSKEVPVWSSTVDAKKERNCLMKLLFKTYFENFIRINPIPMFYFIPMIYFVLKYSYWYDFFKSNNIKINLSPCVFPKTSIPMNLALEKNGGISVTYQYSSVETSSFSQSIYSDVFFTFGPGYRWVFNTNNSVINNNVYCGYTTDYSFKETKEDALIIRNKLLGRGVKFIICYFDENSSDDRMSIIPNSRSSNIYKKLFEWVLDDKTLGLICSPKFPGTLFSRMPVLREMMDKLSETGRFILMNGFPLTDNYPAEAAQAADLCIGILHGSTAVLESFLAGVPSIFLDMEKFYSNPIYKYGNGRVVFDDLDELCSAIKKYREDPDNIPGFGDLSLWIKNKDPFRDGNASLRIGQYVNWLLDAFDQSKTRDAAIKYANYKYAEHWGKGFIIVSDR